MVWALTQHDPQGLLDNRYLRQSNELIEQNDGDFKYWLDRYKYADRHLEMSQTEYRLRGEAFLQVLEVLLTDNAFLLGDKASIADISIMPFIRQFAHVNRKIFYSLYYPKVQHWLQYWLQQPYFLQAMSKAQPWQEGDDVVTFPT